jgi:Ca-activated chloride channel family protein
LTPRYNPPDPAAAAARLVRTLAEHAAGAGRPASLSGAVAEAPQARLEVRLQAGFPLEEVESLSHDVETWWDTETLVIEPRGGTVAADRDFLQRWRPLLGHEPRSALFTESRGSERYALLMMLPPLEGVEAGAGLPTETLFIVDVSGSMKGPSIRQAREALLAALYRLRPDDTFNLMAFSDALTEFAPTFQPASDDALARAAGWVRDLRAGGGTEIFPALQRGVELSRLGEVDRVQRIIFLTDGAVGNEDQVLRSLLADLGPVRLHTLGIGRAPNRYLMRRMADHGRGLCDFIAETAEAENRVDAFLARLDRPVMTGLSLEWEGTEPLEIYPPGLPDLHAGEPLLVSARLAAGASPGAVRLHGRTAGGPLSFEMLLDESAPRDSGVATRWARAQVASLMADLLSGSDPDSVRARIIQVSKRFHIVTRFTSLVAVEEFPSAVDEARWVRVPNALPSSAGLAQGGTHDRLLLLTGLLLSLAGGALLVMLRGARPA